MLNTDVALYRGLDNDGNWKYGALLCGECDTGNKKKTRYFIAEMYDPCGGYFDTEEVRGETVSKFTGLYDCTTWEELSTEEQEAFFKSLCADASEKAKEVFLPLCGQLWKGRKIFTGDVVKHFTNEFDGESSDLGLITWDSTNLRFHRTSQRHKGKFFPLSTACTYKVVGNFKDTPGLFSDAMGWADPEEPEV